MSLETLLDKADLIAKELASTEAAKDYWQAKRKMETNERAQQLFEDLKLKTNTSLILQERLTADHPKVMLAELEIREVEHALHEIPVAMQYKEAQAELNELMQSVVQVVLHRLVGELPVEMGPRQGCGNGHGGNGCDCGH